MLSNRPTHHSISRHGQCVRVRGNFKTIRTTSSSETAAHPRLVKNGATAVTKNESTPPTRKHNKTQQTDQLLRESRMHKHPHDQLVRPPFAHRSSPNQEQDSNTQERGAPHSSSTVVPYDFLLARVSTSVAYTGTNKPCTRSTVLSPKSPRALADSGDPRLTRSRVLVRRRRQELVHHARQSLVGKVYPPAPLLLLVLLMLRARPRCLPPQAPVFLDRP